jgi:enterochelin esterase-like enzyme
MRSTASRATALAGAAALALLAACGGGTSTEQGSGPTETTARPGCATIPANGEVTSVTTPGTSSGLTGKPTWIYLPPSWCTNDGTQYPVMMLIHGAPSPEGGHDWITTAKAAEIADEFAASHGGKAPVLVFPDAGSPNDTECVDSTKYGKLEQYLSVDVPGWVESADQFKGRLQPRPQGWTIGGYSLGGTCGLTLALRHPDVWHTIADYGGDAFGVDDATSASKQKADTTKELFDGDGKRFDDHDPAVQLQKKGDLSAFGAWFSVGGNDQTTMKDIRHYHDLAKQAGMKVCWQVVPNEDHSFEATKAAFKASLPWISARTGLFPMTPEIEATCKNP